MTPDLPVGSGWVNHIDMIGGCSEEDMEISLRYYDTEEDRQRWARDFPGDTLPPHEDPPYDRDKNLPTPPTERPEWEESDGDGPDGEDQWGEEWASEEE